MLLAVAFDAQLIFCVRVLNDKSACGMILEKGTDGQIMVHSLINADPRSVLSTHLTAGSCTITLVYGLFTLKYSLQIPCFVDVYFL